MTRTPGPTAGYAPPRQGFTLIELLVVIALIGILSTIVLIAINPAQRVQAAYDSQRKSDLAQIRNALEAYATANNSKYPLTNAWRCDDCGIYDPGDTTYTEDNWIPGLISGGFIKRLPHDPQNGQQSAGYCGPNGGYGYLYYSNGTDYKLLAHCTVKTDLNRGSPSQPPSVPSPNSPYCSNRGAGWVGGYDDAAFNDTPNGNASYKLKSLVDPVRYTYAYAVYSKGATCL